MMMTWPFVNYFFYFYPPHPNVVEKTLSKSRGVNNGHTWSKAIEHKCGEKKRTRIINYLLTLWSLSSVRDVLKGRERARQCNKTAWRLSPIDAFVMWEGGGQTRGQLIRKSVQINVDSRSVQEQGFVNTRTCGIKWAGGNGPQYPLPVDTLHSLRQSLWPRGLINDKYKSLNPLLLNYKSLLRTFDSLPFLHPSLLLSVPQNSLANSKSHFPKKNCFYTLQLLPT